MKTPLDRKTEQGFTLIEIIAVLVLLGVLAAVIVPKYNSLVADAKTKAVNAALAEGIARVNAAAASYILTGGGTVAPSYSQLNTNMLSTYAGDYQLGYDGTKETAVVITATGVGANVKDSSGATTVVLPQ